MLLQPYTPTNEEQILLRNNAVTTADDWTKSIYKSIKQRIKAHLLAQQNKICIYCRLKLSLAQYSPPIEHIVPKNLHHIFMFEQKNLTISCETCNRKKWQTETLVNPQVIIYPTSGAEFIIFHPYFDEYNDHIEILGGIFSKAKSSKGEKTIEICKLDRVDLAEERARTLGIERQERIKQLVIGLMKEENSHIKIQLKEFIDRGNVHE